MKRKPRLGLVIGSGGLKCASAIGVMQVLEQENINLDLVIGCSGGAVFGAAIALGFSSEMLVEAQTKAWTSSITKKIDFRSLVKIALPSLAGFDDEIGIFDDGVMTQNLESVLGAGTTFADTKIPFYCVATDFKTGEPIVISKGKLAKAVRASSGIPVAFKPLELNGRLLIDGGLSNPLPVDVAIQEGADIIIAVGFETPMVQSVSSPALFAAQMFNILVNQLLYRKFAFYNLATHSEIITIVPHFEATIKVNEVNSVPFIIEQGRNEILKHVAHLRQALAVEDTTQNL